MSYRKPPRIQQPAGDVVLIGCFAWLVAALLLLWIEAWLVMLTIGALHHEVDERIPAFGYIACLWISVALNIIASFFKARSIK